MFLNSGFSCDTEYEEASGPRRGGEEVGARSCTAEFPIKKKIFLIYSGPTQGPTI